MAEVRSGKSGQGFRPKKRLGQHFLRDRNIIQKIIDLSGFGPNDRVLEIGSGLGALTIPLSERVREIVAVEKDSLLVEMLEKKLSQAGINNVTLINEDILKFDMDRSIGRAGEKMKAIGNLPYNISSPFLAKLFKHRDIISGAVLMFQFEFARRLLSSPGGKDYGAITVSIQYDASVSPLIKVSKESFYPRPKVGSMVLTVDMERPYPRRAEDEVKFHRVVSGAFAHRRKTVLNSLKGSLLQYNSDEIRAALEGCGIDPVRRAETLSIDDFLNLSAALKN